MFRFQVTVKNWGVLDVGIVFAQLLSLLEMVDRGRMVPDFVERKRQIIVGFSRLRISLDGFPKVLLRNIPMCRVVMGDAFRDS